MTTSSPEEEPVLRIPVRELLARLDGRLDQLTNVLATLVTRGDLVQVEEQVHELRERVDRLEDAELTRAAAETRLAQEHERIEREREQKSTHWQWFVMAGLTAVLVALAIVGFVVH